MRIDRHIEYMKTVIRRVLRRIEAPAAALLVIISVSLVFAMPVFAETPEEQADRILAGMTTKQKITQMMVVAMPSSGAAKIQRSFAVLSECVGLPLHGCVNPAPCPDKV